MHKMRAEAARSAPGPSRSGRAWWAHTSGSEGGNVTR